MKKSANELAKGSSRRRRNERANTYQAILNGELVLPKVRVKKPTKKQRRLAKAALNG
jgi:hypothetical protein